jgi:hypothetical protein
VARGRADYIQGRIETFDLSSTSNGGYFEDLSYGSSILGVAAGIAQDKHALLARVNAVNRVNLAKNSLAGLEGLSSSNPAVLSIDQTRLSLLKNDVLSIRSLDGINQLPGTTASGLTFNTARNLQFTANALGVVGTAASVGEVAFDVADAIQDGRSAESQLLASTTTVALGGAASFAAFKTTALGVTAITANPLLGIGAGVVVAGAVGLGFNIDFSGDPSGSNSISSQFKNTLFEFFEDVSNAEATARQYERRDPSLR